MFYAELFGGVWTGQHFGLESHARKWKGSGGRNEKPGFAGLAVYCEHSVKKVFSKPVK